MSRHAFLHLLALGALVGAAPACAQDPQAEAAADQTQPLSAEAAATLARRLLQGTNQPRCGVPAVDGSIVVCGGREASEKERLPLRDQLESAHSTNDGLPRAPNVSGLRDCSRGCVGFGGVPPPMYYFDIAALPQAPPDSDADKIAKGEIRAP